MLLKTLFVQPLGPAAVLILGGLLLALGRRLARSSALWADSMVATRPDRANELKVWLHLLRTPIAMLAAGAAVALLMYLRGLQPRPDLEWNWQPLTVSGSSMTWLLDSWNWLASLLIVTVAAISILVGADPERGRVRVDLLGADTERTLLLAAAGLAFVASGNLLTLATTWVVLDAALAIRLQSFRSGQPAARAWGILSLLGVLLLLLLALLGEENIRTSLSGGRLTGLELSVLWFAALVRAGVYPFHFWRTAAAERPRYSWGPASLIVGTAGLWLLARVQALGCADWVRRPEWMAFGALALLGTALVAWTVEDGPGRWRWIALNRTGLAMIAAYMSPAPRPDLLAWPVVVFALGCGLLLAGQSAAERMHTRLPIIAASLVLWGMPGTAGFLARSSLVFPTELRTAAPLFVVILLSEVLLVASLWQVATGDVRPNERPPRWTTIVAGATAVVIAGVPLLLWGLFPTQLARLAGFEPAEAFSSLRTILPITRRSVWIGLAVSVLLGGALGLLRERVFGHMRGWQAGIAQIASLEWLYRGVGGLFLAASSVLRYFAALGEGEGYLGWLAVAGFLLWVLLRA